MAKSRRKNGGPTRGRFKLKKLGKGWSTQRRVRVIPKPAVPKPNQGPADSTHSAATKSTGTPPKKA